MDAAAALERAAGGGGGRSAAAAASTSSAGGSGAGAPPHGREQPQLQVQQNQQHQRQHHQHQQPQQQQQQLHQQGKGVVWERRTDVFDQEDFETIKFVNTIYPDGAQCIPPGRQERSTNGENHTLRGCIAACVACATLTHACAALGLPRIYCPMAVYYAPMVHAGQPELNSTANPGSPPGPDQIPQPGQIHSLDQTHSLNTRHGGCVPCKSHIMLS
eukprot:361135-Chlamydomonas_euryale.AAC.3